MCPPDRIKALPEILQLSDTWQEVNTSLTSEFHKKSHMMLDDVHSFVLRLHLNPAPGGRGSPRPQFKLEHVNQGTNKRMQSLDEVFKELTVRIEGLLKN